ncbi:probable RNA-binding protein 18 [Homarus americanus]|uniref:RNA-binding protein 18-like n=1 Tax=Homarus americanus TaxID=6706 RepID=A0A8J5JWV3_HOMAM|nr:probable RNA-binding protein 18 [Homarus americanus]KAG7163751.1 RNA-binding protein 18-like [Homarus americanus]
MTAEVTLPVPLPPKDSARTDDRRLWVGNLDSRLREYQLLKMVENFGPLVEFDFLYHRSGPQAGQPRGYAFVTFESSKSAQTAMRVLDGKIILGRRMAVKWAHAQDESMFERNKEKPAPPILSGGKAETSQISKKSKIAALEAKLKLLEEDHLKVDLTPDVGASAARPTSVTYAFIERKPGPKPQGATNRSYHSSSHPYHKSKTSKK